MNTTFPVPPADLHPDLLKDAMYRLDAHATCDLAASFSVLFWNEIYLHMSQQKTEAAKNGVQELLEAMRGVTHANALYYVTFSAERSLSVMIGTTDLRPPIEAPLIQAAAAALTSGTTLLSFAKDIGDLVAIPCYDYRTLNRPDLMRYNTCGQIALIQEMRSAIQYSKDAARVAPPSIPSLPHGVIGAVVGIRTDTPMSLLAWMRAHYAAEFGAQALHFAYWANAAPMHFPKADAINLPPTTASWQTGIQNAISKSQQDFFRPRRALDYISRAMNEQWQNERFRDPKYYG